MLTSFNPFWDLSCDKCGKILVELDDFQSLLGFILEDDITKYNFLYQTFNPFWDLSITGDHIVDLHMMNFQSLLGFIGNPYAYTINKLINPFQSLLGFI